jgi:phenylacetate-coenzyme A ligase PaaK-like adenylate-forming protein
MYDLHMRTRLFTLLLTRLLRDGAFVARYSTLDCVHISDWMVLWGAVNFERKRDGDHHPSMYGLQSKSNAPGRTARTREA